MKRQLLALTLTALLPFAAQSQEISYTYLEGGYSRLNSDIDADGWGLNGSLALNESFHAFGNYSRSEFENSNIDLETFSVGLGTRYALKNQLHLLAQVGYENANPELQRSNEAWFAEAGARAAIGSRLEGWVLVGYEDGGNIDNEVYSKLGMQLKFPAGTGLARWGLVSEIKFIDDDEQFFIGPRLSF